MFVPIFICINELKGLQYMIFAPYDMLQFKRIKSTYLSWINSFPHLGLCNHLWIIAGIAFLFTLVILRQRWLAKNATFWNDNVQELEKDGSDKGQQELRQQAIFQASMTYDSFNFIMSNIRLHILNPIQKSYPPRRRLWIDPKVFTSTSSRTENSASQSFLEYFISESLSALGTRHLFHPVSPPVVDLPLRYGVRRLLDATGPWD